MRAAGRAAKFAAEFLGLFKRTPEKALAKAQEKLTKAEQKLSPADQGAIEMIRKRRMQAGDSLTGALSDEEEAIARAGGASPDAINKIYELNRQADALGGRAKEAASPTEDLTPAQFQKRFIAAGVKRGGIEQTLAPLARDFAMQAISGDLQQQANARAGLQGTTKFALPTGIGDEQKALIEKLIQSQEARRTGVTDGRLFNKGDVSDTGVKNVEAASGRLAAAIDAAADRIKTSGGSRTTAYHDSP